MTNKSIHWSTKSFLIVLLIVLFEGALRKWLNIPTVPLMALRDLIIISSILYGLKYFSFRALPEVFLLAWTFLVISWTLIQNMSGLITIPVVVIGIRSWLLYFWFALLCFRTFEKEDIKFILKVFITTLIPMVILAAIQQLSPVSSFINKQPPGGGEIFTVITGIVRPTGTFSFTLGYTTYLAMIGPLVFWLLADGVNFIKNYYYRIIIIGSYFLGVLVSGSRGAIILSIVMLGIWIFTSLLTKKLKLSTKSILLLPFVLGVCLYLLTPIVERAFDANVSRIEAASAVEDTSSRILNTFIGSDTVWENFEIFGQGIGAASNASKKFMPTTFNSFALGENEIDRILNEGGIVGLFFEVIKIIIAISGLIVSLKILIKNKDTLPILFWTYLTIQLLTATTTGQITVNAFTFLSLGLGWCLLKIYKRETI